MIFETTNPTTNKQQQSTNNTHTHNNNNNNTDNKKEGGDKKEKPINLVPAEAPAKPAWGGVKLGGGTPDRVRLQQSRKCSVAVIRG